MIVVDSIGFAATHTICGILAELPGFDVSHGSQNFDAKTPIGVESQTPGDFVQSMARAASAGRHPVAVHTNFAPTAMRAACAAQGVSYSLLVRRPEAQIESCYSWIAAKVLEGDAMAFVTTLKQMLTPLQQAGLPTNLSNLLYGYAVYHVCGFNLMGLQTGAPILRMEELLTDEAAFRAAFAVPQAQPIGHFSGTQKHLSSHRRKVQDGTLAAPDRAALLDRLRPAVDGVSLRVHDLGLRLGYA